MSEFQPGDHAQDDIVDSHIEEQVESETEELQKIELETLSKVVDLRDPSQKIAFHTLAYGGDNTKELLAGLLYSEQVLDQGLLSKRVAERAGIIGRSLLGYNRDNPSQNGEAGISVHSMRQYLAMEKYAEPSFRWAMIIAPGDTEIIDGGWDYDEITFKDRIKPDKIIGIQVARELLDLPIVRGLEQVISRLEVGEYHPVDQATGLQFNASSPFLERLRIIAQEFGITFSEDQIRELDEAKNLLEQIAKKYEGQSNGQSYPTREQLTVRMQERNEAILPAVRIIADEFQKHPNFPDAITVDDYLRIISHNKEIPIYTSGGDLHWPRPMSQGEVKQFVQEKNQ